MLKIHNSYLDHPESLTMEEALAQSGNLTLAGFFCREEAESFAATLPKFVRARVTEGFGQVRKGELTSGQKYRYGSYVRFESEFTFKDGPFNGVTVYQVQDFGVTIYTSPLNGTTGAANETGQKRIRRFMEAALREVEEYNAEPEWCEGCSTLEVRVDERSYPVALSTEGYCLECERDGTAQKHREYLEEESEDA